MCVWRKSHIAQLTKARSENIEKIKTKKNPIKRKSINFLLLFLTLGCGIWKKKYKLECVFERGETWSTSGGNETRIRNQEIEWTAFTIYSYYHSRPFKDRKSFLIIGSGFNQLVKQYCKLPRRGGVGNYKWKK